MFSSVTVEALRFKGLMVKEGALGQELFGSRFFSSFVAAGVVDQSQVRKSTILLN